MRLIDADALILDLDDSLFYIDAIPFVEDSPTIDAVEVRHGKWIRCMHIMHRYYTLKCSCCGGYALNTDSGNYVDSNYCPHCGATMDGE